MSVPNVNNEDLNQRPADLTEVLRETAHRRHRANVNQNGANVNQARTEERVIRLENRVNELQLQLAQERQQLNEARAEHEQQMRVVSTGMDRTLARLRQRMQAAIDEGRRIQRAARNSVIGNIFQAVINVISIAIHFVR